jgi:hypothetical protein
LINDIIKIMASGITSRYLIPFPFPTDPVNVSGDMEDLAEKVDEIIGANVGNTSYANFLFVSKTGNDDNDGLTLGNAFLTIKKALSVATENSTVFVKSGDYTEDNPITIPRRVGVVGDNLRTVTIRPANPTQDIFYVNNACFVTGITFRDHLHPAAAFAFNPNGSAGLITTSPYIQDCSSITTTGKGMYIDGNAAQGLKSMVLDAYTQFNQGGTGIHIDNEGYAQLVSIFTICTQDGILCTNGASCSITNSNCSFGTFGLRSEGLSQIKFSGLTNGVDQTGTEIIIDGLGSNVPIVNGVISFNEGTTVVSKILLNDLATITTDQPHGLIAGRSFKVMGLGQPFDGIFDVISSTTNTITYACPGDNTNEILDTGSISQFYTVDRFEQIASGEFKVFILERVRNPIPDNTNVDFYARSFISASSHTFEYVGSGNDLFTALPAAGGIPVQEFEVVSSKGGQVFFTSTDQKGDFRIGGELTINRADGTISGRTFDRSLFAVLTPYILAIEG